MRLAPFALTCLLVVGESFAQTAPAPAADPVAELASAEADLAALRIGAALSRIEALLARSDLGEEVRVEALTSRAKAHAADNKLAATEEDYRQILARG